MKIVRLFDDLCCSVYTADNTVKALPPTEDSTITNHEYSIIVNRIRCNNKKVVLNQIVFTFREGGTECIFSRSDRFLGGRAQKIHECNTVDTTTADITLPGGLTKCISISHSSSCFGLMVCG